MLIGEAGKHVRTPGAEKHAGISPGIPGSKSTGSMQGYKYNPGDRPLSGYTIQAVAGRGGFGEVYYAISDSGREIALKSVTGHTQIELRGISQCMNLKSPHLVSIFDVVHNDNGDPFVVMEFIEGPNLRTIMDQHPEGLGTAKAAFFMREIGKGLSYLHDCGIVHRDLKPANIFYENGYVKIGDYGLSKAMSASVNQSHTVTVGSVHYMAPEVGAGKYDRSIDIYAMGCLLYEMLTGITPFLGQSPAEILMKHMSGEPDMTGVDEPFASVIRKAMAKDPADRYATIQEMVEALFGAEHIQNSVSHFNDADLSVYAQRLVDQMPASGTAVAATPDTPQPEATASASEPPLFQAAQSVAYNAGRAIGSVVVTRDPLTRGKRLFLGAVSLFVIALMTSVVGEGAGIPKADLIFFGVVLSAIGSVIGLKLFWTRLAPGMQSDSPLIRRWSAYATLVAGGAVASFPTWIDTHHDAYLQSLLAAGLGLATVNWYHLTHSKRQQRLRLLPVLGAGLAASIVALFLAETHFWTRQVCLPCVIGLASGLTLFAQVLFSWKSESRVEPTPQAAPQPQPAARPLAQAVPQTAEAGVVSEADQVSPAPGPQAGAVQPSPLLQPDGRIASTRNRTIALLLAGFPILGFPICGLHRFYTGRVGSGLVWLFTFGLLGIGQLIDAIILLAGEFKDATDRPVRFWGAAPVGVSTKSAAQAAKKAKETSFAEKRNAQHASVYRAGGFDFVSLLLTSIASVMILIGLLLSVLVGLHLPEAVASGMLSDDLARELKQAFGYQEWGTLVMMLLKIASYALIIVGGLLGMWARRRFGPLHVIRGFLGGVGFVFTALLINIWIHRWIYIDDDQLSLQQAMMRVAADVVDKSPILGVQRLMEWVGQNQGPFIFSLIFFAISVLILAWPPLAPKQTDERHVTG